MFNKRKPWLGVESKYKMNSPVVLRLRRTQLAYLCHLAGASTCRSIVVAGLAADILLEHCIVFLKKSGDVVPKRRRKLRRDICNTEETAVGVLDRVQNLPCWVRLVRIRGDIRVIDCHVQDTEGHWVNIINAWENH